MLLSALRFQLCQHRALGRARVKIYPAAILGTWNIDAVYHTKMAIERSMATPRQSVAGSRRIILDIV